MSWVENVHCCQGETSKHRRAQRFCRTRRTQSVFERSTRRKRNAQGVPNLTVQDRTRTKGERERLTFIVCGAIIVIERAGRGMLIDPEICPHLTVDRTGSSQTTSRTFFEELSNRHSPRTTNGEHTWDPTTKSFWQNAQQASNLPSTLSALLKAHIREMSADAKISQRLLEEVLHDAASVVLEHDARSSSAVVAGMHWGDRRTPQGTNLPIG